MEAAFRRDRRVFLRKRLHGSAGLRTRMQKGRSSPLPMRTPAFFMEYGARFQRTSKSPGSTPKRRAKMTAISCGIVRTPHSKSEIRVCVVPAIAAASFCVMRHSVRRRFRSFPGSSRAALSSGDALRRGGREPFASPTSAASAVSHASASFSPDSDAEFRSAVFVVDSLEPDCHLMDLLFTLAAERRPRYFNGLTPLFL